MPDLRKPYAGSLVGYEQVKAAELTTSGFNPGAAGTVYIQNFPLVLANNETIASVGTGVQRLVPIDLPKDFAVTTILTFSGTTALAAGSGPHYWVALYDQFKKLLGQSTDNITKAIAAKTLISDSLATTVNTTYSGLYYIGILDTQGSGTLPTYTGFTSVIGAQTQIGSGGFALGGGSADTALAATAPATAGTLTPIVNIPWVGVA